MKLYIFNLEIPLERLKTTGVLLGSFHISENRIKATQTMEKYSATTELQTYLISLINCFIK